jgi:tight adherence protein B
MSVGTLLVAVLIGLTAAFLVMAIYKAIKAPAQKKRFTEALADIHAGELYDIDSSFAENKIEKPTGWMSYWRIKGQHAGQEYENNNQAGIGVLRNAVVGALFGALVFPRGALGLVLGPVVIIVGQYVWLKIQAGKRVSAMEKQLPLLLSGLRSYLQAGSTPQQAIISVAGEIPSPLGDELIIVRQNVNVAMPLDEALRRLSERVPSREMQFLASSIEIAIQSGANLEPQLRTIEGVVAQRSRVRAKLATAIASVRPTQIAATIAVPVFFLNSLREGESQAFWFSPDSLIYWLAILFLSAFGVWGIRILIKRVQEM